MKTCTFTGHFPLCLPFAFSKNGARYKLFKGLLTFLIREQIENGVTRFLTRMALDIDCIAAEIIIKLRKKFPEISLEAVLTYAEQQDKRRKKQALRYKKILKKCDKVTVLQDEYASDCIQRRNCFMVDISDCVLAVWNGTTCGTAKTVFYALGKNLPVTVLNPTNNNIEIL